MKKKLQMKHKVMIGAGAGVAAATAIAAPLAVTLSNNQIINPNNLDAVYGVDDNTYKSMKAKLAFDYSAELEKQHLKDVEKAIKMEELNTSLDDLDEQVARMKKAGQDNVHTVATTVLMKQAKDKFNVTLERKTRANWAEVRSMFEGMKSSFNTYMENHNFSRDKIAQVLAKAEASYNDMLSQLKTQFANDILGGVLKAKVQLVSCFDTINTEIAKLAGTARLNEFVANYQFIFRDDATSYKDAKATDNRLDVILKQLGKVGDSISQNNMNKLFVVFNTETRQLTEFNPNMIPGYVLTPKYAGFKSDGITNQHSILVDWTIVSQNVEEKDRDAATAHLIKVDEKLAQKTTQDLQIQSISDIYDNSGAEIQLTEYEILATSGHEANLLQQTYFNKEGNGANIELTWTDAKAHKYYDGFMYADETSSEPQYLNLRQLAETGIVIRNGKDSRLLKDVFATIDIESYEPKDMIEKFVKYCDVQDKVEFKNNANGVILVTNTFKAYYKNDETWNQHYQDALGTCTIGEPVPASSADFPISEDFFRLVNNAYNRSYEQAHRYMDKTYKKMAHSANITNTIQWTLSTLCAYVIIPSIFVVMVAAMITQNWVMAFVYFIALAGVSVCWYFSNKNANLFEKNFCDPMTGYKARADLFTGGQAYDDVDDILKNDNHYFAMYDENGQVDARVYKDKLIEFQKLDISTQKRLFHTYNYFTSETAALFFQQVRSLGIDPAQFSRDFGDWTKTGKNAIISFACDAGMMAICAALALLPSGEVKAQSATIEAEETTAQEVEMTNLYALGRYLNPWGM